MRWDMGLAATVSASFQNVVWRFFDIDWSCWDWVVDLGGFFSVLSITALAGDSG